MFFSNTEISWFSTISSKKHVDRALLHEERPSKGSVKTESFFDMNSKGKSPLWLHTFTLYLYFYVISAEIVSRTIGVYLWSPKEAFSWK